MRARQNDVATQPLHLWMAALVLLFGLAYAPWGHSDLRLVDAARQQVGITLHYDPAYTRLTYPKGDVPQERGVCTDVIIRALRVAHGLDLQQAVHEDMKAHFSAYPSHWGLRRPDRNIDHRRVPNLQTYFRRHALALRPSNDPTAFKPGDIVTSMLPGNLPHIMVVSDRATHTGVPLVIHNIGRGTREEDALFAHPLTGHYRLPERSQP